MTKNRMRAVALVAAGVLAGGVTAATITATAASNDPSPSSQTDTDHDGDGDGDGGGHHGEKALTGADLAKATAVAEKAVPGGKIDEAENDSGDAAYEVHMTKSDGTEVTVKMDKSFALKGVESGKGK